MKEMLLVFARYPEVGQCKTRLIEALGAQGATDLHVRMSQHTLTWARGWAAGTDARLRVHFAGGDAAAMARHFGEDLSYEPQVDGDLGAKLRRAVKQAVADGAERVMVVGTDCPWLNASMARRAGQLLEQADVCLVPAADGGYTLLGLSGQGLARTPHLVDALFSQIDWGTPDVLQQTVQRLSAVGANVCLLPTLSDVDLPADVPAGLAALAAAETGQLREPAPWLSIIIPTLGTEEGLAAAIDSAGPSGATEVIIVAAQHTGQVLETAARAGAQLMSATVGRANQMNAGAAVARGGCLLFLHADTVLPAGFEQEIEHVLQDPQVVGGAFRLHIDSPRSSMRWIERGVDLRTRLRNMPYGDQAIFVRRPVFDALGGFRVWPIMEDYEFVRRVRRQGRLAYLAAAVRTSPRRWERLGPWRTTCINQLMVLGYHAGVPVERLARFYRRQKK